MSMTEEAAQLIDAVHTAKLLSVAARDIVQGKRRAPLADLVSYIESLDHALTTAATIAADIQMGYSNGEKL